jgi:short subunit dehydrogenase-like uncharacterized protein
VSRIVVFGAAGYTGRLVAGALVARGRRPLLVGRSRSKLTTLARALGGAADVAEASADESESLARHVRAGDVVVSTVGPFGRVGDAAVEAALSSGAHYLDSNGEPAFTRRIFERYGPPAEQAGIGLLTAFGWECVLGNLAGARALYEARGRAVRVDTGYFYDGRVGFSDGTRASFADAVARPHFAYRDSALRTVRGAERYRRFPVCDGDRPGVSFGGSEHLALPRTFPELREVNSYQGWFGGLDPRIARLLQAGSRLAHAALGRRRARGIVQAANRRLLRSSGGGPAPVERATAGVRVVGIAHDRQGQRLGEVHLAGAEGYEFTARVLAWGAERLATGGPRGHGALGPVEAFGIDALEGGCREAGVGRL